MPEQSSSDAGAWHLPVTPPVAPMLANAAHELPSGESLRYEPKWDGFRCIVFKDRTRIELGSRNDKPLTRYFPEVVESLQGLSHERAVLDGEIVIVGSRGLDFDALLARIHPADSRVRMLAASTPATFVAFDLLALADTDLQSNPYDERRRLLVEHFDSQDALVVSPSTADRDVAADWFARFEGAGFDGVVAKDAAQPYVQGKRTMVKVKHERSADCVVGGMRLHKDGEGVGSLLLGLFDDDGVLHHLGVASSFEAKRRRELTETLAPYLLSPEEPHPWRSDGPAGQRRPGTPSRWSAGKELDFVALRPELVVEVAYDHLQGDRFRHATRLLRFRPDRDPSSCTYGQLEEVAPAELSDLFGSGH